MHDADLDNLDNADKIAVMLVLSGNSEAYGDIVHRYKDVVFKAVYAIVKNYHTAEDLTQDTFVDGYIKLKSLRDPDSIGAWLVTIAKNKCRNFLTRSALRYESELHDFIPDTNAATPEDFLMKKQERLSLEQAIQRLPDLHKTVAVLYYYENYSHNKIAEFLNIPVGTVKSRLYDARLKLKKELEEMKDNNNETVNKDFEKQIAEKIKSLKNYYALHNNSNDGFDNELKTTVDLIGGLPESKAKHAAYADAYYTASWHDKTYRDKALQEAELGENAQVMASILINKYINNNDDELIAKFGEAVPEVKKMQDSPENKNAIGELLFWRGMKYFGKGRDDKDLSKLDKAYADLKEAEENLLKTNVYHANAIAGMKAVEIERNDQDKYIEICYGICGEGLRFNNGKLTFDRQPGVGNSSNIANFISLFYCISSNFDSTFFDENMNTGEENAIVYKSEHIKENTLTLISKNEKVTVLAGEFENCLHIKLKGTDYWGDDPHTADVYYAKDVGLVKAEFVSGDKIENYELCEYKADKENAGSVYMPFAVGNFWRYKNTNLPSIYWQFIEREIINIETRKDEGSEGVYANFSAVSYVRLGKNAEYSDDCDSDTYIMLAEKAVPYKRWDEEPKNRDFDSAIKYLKYAVQKNTTVRANLYAAAGVEYLERFKQYYEKGWHIMPCALDSIVLTKDKQSGTIRHSSYGYYLAPSQDWGNWWNERKCLARNPFRYLQELFGILYSDKWIAGYSEQIKHEDGEIYLKVDDGGTITTKAGTFTDCIKLTVELEKTDETDEGYYVGTPKYSHCGTKIYYYAPNVGIVKYECIWGKALYASMELSEYKSYATNGEYMPIYVGNNWVYDEVTLQPEFIERSKFNIVSGMEDEFFMVSDGEMLFKGTDEEYEEFKKSLEK